MSREDADDVGTLGDLDRAVGGHVAEHLGRPARRPRDRQRLDPDGVELPAAASPGEKLKLLQKLMAAGDPRARGIFESLGVYLGYGLLLYSEFYVMKHVLLLGRVTSGEGGNLLLETARRVLRTDYVRAEQNASGLAHPRITIPSSLFSADEKNAATIGAAATQSASEAGASQ